MNFFKLFLVWTCVWFSCDKLVDIIRLVKVVPARLIQSWYSNVVIVLMPTAVVHSHMGHIQVINISINEYQINNSSMVWHLAYHWFSINCFCHHTKDLKYQKREINFIGTNNCHYWPIIYSYKIDFMSCNKMIIRQLNTKVQFVWWCWCSRLTSHCFILYIVIYIFI